MKFKTLLTCLLLLSALTLVGQNSETEKASNKDSFSLSLETPFFYKDIYGEKGNVGYINFEYLNRRRENFAHSYNIGMMFIASIYDTVFVPDPVLKVEYTALFGKNRHFFEAGGGFNFPGAQMTLRVGYRLQLKKHFLLRIAYTPSIHWFGYSPLSSINNAVSVSLGYRFGMRQKTSSPLNNKTLRKNSFSVSLETHLFFNDIDGESANIGFVNLEYLNRMNEHFSNSYSIGFMFFYYFNNYFEFNERFLPVFNLQYNAVFGRKTHFFETGVGLMVPGFIFNFRFGYRMNIKKHFLLRIAYTPSIWLEPYEDANYYYGIFTGVGLTGFHGLSVGFGYRFGFQKRKKRD